MKLIYRGNTYELNRNQALSGNAGQPTRPTQTARAPYTLIYRGVTLTVDPAAPTSTVAARPGTYELLYRGTAYQVTRDAQGAATAVTRPAGKTAAQKVVVPSTLPVSAIAKVHKANLLNNVQRRLQAAQERRDQALIAQLEAEQQEIATAYSH